MDGATYAALLARMRERHEQGNYWSGRQAVIRSEGLLGGLTEGFFSMIRTHHEWRVFSDAVDAFAWLSPDAGLALNAEVKEIVEAACGTPVLLRRLRDFLRLHVANTELADAAAALALSERSMQRELRKLGTSFQSETDDIRVEVARWMLKESDLKIEAIALAVGCSHSHLCSLFHRRTGQTPAAYRSRCAPHLPGRR